MRYSQAQLTAMAKHVLALREQGDDNADYMIAVLCAITNLHELDVIAKIQQLAKGETVT